jgi:arylsulfatase
MGYSDPGCFGSEIKTPNIDRLAVQGVRMTQFYNASRSCPSRASLLTGLYQHQAGVGDMVSDLGYPSYQGYLMTGVLLLPKLLLKWIQYLYVGKWHVGGGLSTPSPKRFRQIFRSYCEQEVILREAIQGHSSSPWMLGDEDFNPPQRLL